jgi:hypothetical protein
MLPGDTELSHFSRIWHLIINPRAESASDKD